MKIPTAFLTALFALAGCTSAPVVRAPANFELIAVANLPANISSPITVHSKAPMYPYGARRAGLEGSALVQCLVTDTGAVQDASIITASDWEFGESALAAIHAWSFRPGTRDGSNVSMRVGVPFYFTLDDSAEQPKPTIVYAIR